MIPLEKEEKFVMNKSNKKDNRNKSDAGSDKIGKTSGTETDRKKLKRKRRTKAEIEKEKEEKEEFKEKMEEMRIENTILTLKLEQLNDFANEGGTKGQKAHHLYSLISDPVNIWSSYDAIRSNKGGTTPGITKEDTADAQSEERVNKLQELIKEGKYLPKPVRRIYIPKPGKKKKRPLGVPDFTDKLVQDGIRLLLNIIYEPVFKEINTNFGFRPGIGTRDAIKRIQEKARGMQYAIEGDIQGAYDNVEFTTMNSLLRKKIEDKKFLKLIADSFKAGYMENNELIQPEIGVPQGNIASPTYFNIYAHELDIFINKYLTRRFEDLNKKQERSKISKSNKAYQKIHSKVVSTRARIGTIEKRMKRNLETWQTADKETRDKLQTEHKLLSEHTKRRNKTPSISKHGSPLRYSYTRYADDWIVLHNWTREGSDEIKKVIETWLQNKLKLELSQEKTLITNIVKDEAKFLGFTFRNNQKHTSMTSYTIKSTKNTYNRRATLALFTGIDKDRVLGRMRIKNIITKDKTPRGRSCPILQVLQDHQIVEKYRQMITGIYGYYYQSLTIPDDLGQIHYYYFYSCLHTLAARRKETIRGILRKYGKAIEVRYNTKELRDSKEVDIWKKISFPTIKELRTQNEKLRILQKTRDKYLYLIKKEKDQNPTEARKQELLEILNLRGKKPQRKNTIEKQIEFRLNTRSRKLIRKYCQICFKRSSAGYPLESHHIKPLSKIKNKKERFERIISNINALQIIVCRECHNKIHRSGYKTIGAEMQERIRGAIQQELETRNSDTFELET